VADPSSRAAPPAHLRAVKARHAERRTAPQTSGDVRDRYTRRVDTLRTLDPVLQALLAGCMTWGLTALGAAVVFFFRGYSKRMLDAMLGAAAGVMIAASFWSLLAPAIALAEEDPGGPPAWLPALLGFLAGGLFLRLIDRLLPHLHRDLPLSAAEGPPTRLRRTQLLVLAITLHNIPEGLAVGVAFGAAGSELHGTSLGAAFALALGIGLQNLPEGTAVSMPLHREGLSRARSFWWGQLSAIVEPIAAVIGAFAVTHAQASLPYALAFAAGAMIFVVVEELVPEAQGGQHSHLATLATLGGFALMMLLDVALS